MFLKKIRAVAQQNVGHIPVALFGTAAVLTLIAGAYGLSGSRLFSVRYDAPLEPASSTGETSAATATPASLTLDTTAYDKKLLALAHVATSSEWYEYFLTGTTTPKHIVQDTVASGTEATTSKPRTLQDIKQPWPVKTAYPEYGALLPEHRIVAYYGNFYSTRMGVLGEYPEEVMLAKLKSATHEWEVADPETPVVPAINYIALTAQAAPGFDGKYRARMPNTEIDRALAMADKIHGILILDVQVGKSTLQEELPLLIHYLSTQNVHLAIDPEFSMKGTAPPGKEIGVFTANDINYAINFLSEIVKKNNLPPKVLIVHRFTHDMVVGYKDIKPTPEVQVVIDMDGWGFPEKKVVTYNTVVAKEPVQFTGFKIFYHNDVRAPSTRLITPKEVLDLTPSPSFIQYQ